MKIQATIILLAMLSAVPIAAVAQDANSININLNDVMVNQRTQEMSQMLNSYSASATKPRHEKRSKKGKVVRAAVMQSSIIDPQTTKRDQAVAPSVEQPSI